MIGFLILFIGMLLGATFCLYKLAAAMRLLVFKDEETPKMIYTSYLIMVISIILLCIYIHFLT